MVDNFNSFGYKDIGKAVLEFCRENGIGYVPISDRAGSVITTRNWRNKE